MPHATHPLPEHGAPAAPSIRLLLWQVQSPINLGMILRIAETFAAPVHVFDPSDALGDPQRRETIGDFACGALERRPPQAVAGQAQLRELRGPGRLVATTIDGAVPLTDFTWRAGDLVAIGNEYDGLPAELVAAADVRLCIPLPDVHVPKPKSRSPIDPARAAGVSREGRPNLNAAMATAIIAYDAYCKLHGAAAAGRPAGRGLRAAMARLLG